MADKTLHTNKTLSILGSLLKEKRPIKNILMLIWQKSSVNI